MDELTDSLLLRILSQLNDSADVARCRVAWKAFDAVFPGLRSINLRCSWDWYHSERIRPFKTVFLDHISKLETVESVSIVLLDYLMDALDRVNDDSYLTGEDFTNHWLPRVSGSLKSLSICDHRSQNPSVVLPLISAYCHNLLKLKLKCVWLSVDNMNPMPMLTSLTLEHTDLVDEPLNDFNKCFPNLQFLKLLHVQGLRDPKIHLLNLKTCHLDVHDDMGSLTLITPNLITLKLECFSSVAELHVEAPMLSRFHLSLYVVKPGSLTLKRFENLKTLWLQSYYCGFLLSELIPLIKTVKKLTLGSRYGTKPDAPNPKLTLGKVFAIFPNLSSLCIRASAWSELEACLDPQSLEILDGMKGLKRICAYLMLVDPSLTFSTVACVLDQCVGLLEVSLLFHDDVVGTVSESFMSKCMARWPGLKWRWGIWSIQHELDEPWDSKLITTNYLRSWPTCDQEILDGSKGLNTSCAYVMLVDPSLTFSTVARVLDQCISLLKVSLLIHSDVEDTVSNGFMSKCMARWPGLKWRWGIWSEELEDSWLTDGSSIEHHRSSKKSHL
ncbi:hypothetical protein SSX86_032672 [Deinandra increscens subsp. villosa]|uniref:Uncharacterized protein n=1 Tax=Deinandra increscens subsp. villosa TaxID=3103831 RepID=A0AAP0C2M1_9ASTR